MYAIKTIYVHTGKAWMPKDIESTLITEAIANYRRVQIFLIDEETLLEHQINLSEIGPTLSLNDRNLTIQAFIDKQIDGKYFDITPLYHLANARHMQVTDFMDDDNFLPSLSNRYYHPEADWISPDQRTDLMFTDKRDVNTYCQDMVKNSLFTINGFLTTCFSLDNRLYLKESERYMAYAGNRLNTVSRVDFSDLGGVDIVELSEESFSPLPISNNGLAYKENFIIRLDQSVAERTLFLVINGQPYLELDFIKVVDQNTLCITLDKRVIADRSLKDNILNETTVNLADQGLNYQEFSILNYLSQVPCFIISLEGDAIGIHKRPVGRTDLPGAFTYPFPPTGLFLLNSGRLADYHIDGVDEECTSISIVDTVREIPVYSTVMEEQYYALSNIGRNLPVKELETGYMYHIYTL